MQHERDAQYSMTRILGLWALAALPMGVLSWVVFPRIAPDFAKDPFTAGTYRLAVLTVGLAWIFVLSMIVVRREEGDLKWATIKRRLRLQAPRDPKTNEPRRRLWLWLLPWLAATGAWALLAASPVNALWVKVFPFLAEPAGYSFGAAFKSREVLAHLVGAWWFLILYVVNALLNTVLGEELFFRGVLLPKMEGVFGRWSWAANGVLFGLYHLHQPWGMLQSMIGGALLYAFPTWCFRSTWFGIILHSAQSVYLSFLILGVVLGLA